MNGWKERSSNLIDAILDILEEAAEWLPARFRPALVPIIDERELGTLRGPVRVRVAPDQLFVTPLPGRADDIFEARAIFRLQAGRLSPLPKGDYCASVSRSEDGDWVAAIIRSTELDQIRERARNGSAHIVGFETGPASMGRFIFRGEAEGAERRRTALIRAAAVVLAPLSLVLFFAALAGRAEELDAQAQQDRVRHLTEARAAHDRLEQLGTFDAVQGLSPNALVRSLNTFAEARPDGLEYVSWTYDGNVIRAIAQSDAGHGAQSAPLDPGLSGLVAPAVTLRPLGRRNGHELWEIQASPSGEAAP